MTDTDSKPELILRNIHGIVLNSLCSFFTYPGFELEGTRGHYSTFLKQVVFYTIVGVENIAFSTIGFAYGYGKLMLPDGTSYHMSSTAQYWAQVVIVMAMLAAVILRIVYYRMHPAQPAIIPKLTAKTILSDARRGDKQKHDVENANTECNDALKSEYESCNFCGQIFDHIDDLHEHFVDTEHNLNEESLPKISQIMRSR